MQKRNLGWILFATLAACSSGGGGRAWDHLDGGNMWGADMSGGGGTPDMAVAEYPPGPFGNQPGDTIYNMELEGFRLTTTEQDSHNLTWATDIKMAEYHGGKCKCLVLTMGATWCGACKQEQPALTADVASDPEFCVMNILQEGPGNGSMATQEDVDNWAQAYHQNFYVVQGTPMTRQLWSGYGSTIGLPFNLVIRTSDMKVMDATLIGSQTGAIQGFDSQIHAHAMELCTM